MLPVILLFIPLHFILHCSMGSKQAKFDEETMKEFEATTPLNRAEIYHAFYRFQEIYLEYQSASTEVLPPLLTSTGSINTEAALPVDTLAERMQELKENPFRGRICEIFATSGRGLMSFVEYLDMVSAFSPKNDTYQKTFHAFQIYDVDRDGVISRDDLSAVLDMITDKVLDQQSKEKIIDGVFAEVHKDGGCDGLSTEDFHYAIGRSPDFASTFSFRI